MYIIGWWLFCFMGTFWERCELRKISFVFIASFFSLCLVEFFNWSTLTLPTRVNFYLMAKSSGVKNALQNGRDLFSDVVQWRQGWNLREAKSAITLHKVSFHVVEFGLPKFNRFLYVYFHFLLTNYTKLDWKFQLHSIIFS